jgi:hypothetical protein
MTMSIVIQEQNVRRKGWQNCGGKQLNCAPIVHEVLLFGKFSSEDPPGCHAHYNKAAVNLSAR